MDVDAFLNELRSAPDYAGQAVHVHDVPARDAAYAEPAAPLPGPVAEMLARRNI